MKTKADDEVIAAFRGLVEEGRLTFVGFGGGAGTGKSTLAKIVADEIMRDTECHLAYIIPFAASLRLMASSFFGRDGNDVPREDLIFLGDVLREYDPWCICRAWLSYVSSFVRQFAIPVPPGEIPRRLFLIADDIRLMDECDLLRELGAEPYCVRSTLQAPDAKDHSTERLSKMPTDSPTFLAAFPGGIIRVDPEDGEEGLNAEIVPSILKDLDVGQKDGLEND